MIILNLQFFGGRGASSSGSGGLGTRGPKYEGSLNLPNDADIQFDGTLQYGGKDPFVKGQQRTNIENWESRRVKNKIEYAYAVDEDGTPLGSEIKGGKGSVRVPSRYHNVENAAFTHIHPREAGVLGGTFSEGDLRNLANGNGRNTRAAAKEGTYSMTKNANFDKRGFLGYVAQANRAFDTELSAKGKTLRQSIRDGKMDYKQYGEAWAKSFNTALVNLHKAYLDGQSKFGYTYTLEQR